MVVQWSNELDQLLAGDQVVALASVTPAHGVVIAPMTNFATHDRENGVVRVNSSVGASKKLDRIRRNPNVAVAFHTRNHATTNRPEYVLVQGTATVCEPIERFPDTIGQRWDEKDGPRSRGLWGRWLRVYYTRVPINIAVHRVITWSDLQASAMPVTNGYPALAHPPPQRLPKGGAGARLNPVRVAQAVQGLPDVLLGWVGDDGLPFVVPVSVGSSQDGGVQLTTAAPLLPPGGRRAGLTAHRLSRNVHGAHQRLHTGWLDVGEDACTAIYYPHSGFGFRMPPSTFLYRLAVGYSARRGLRSGHATT